eukprot:g5324.t1
MGNTEGRPGAVAPEMSEISFEQKLAEARRLHDPNYDESKDGGGVTEKGEWLKRFSPAKNTDYWINSYTGQTVYEDPTDGANKPQIELHPELKEEMLDNLANHAAMEIAHSQAEKEASTHLLFDLIPNLEDEEAHAMIIKVFRTREICPDQQDGEGNTLLIYAAEYGSYDMAYHLVHTLQADVNVCNVHGCNALFFSCSDPCSIKITELLLANGIRHEVVDYDHGCTAMHYAATINASGPELLRILLKHECNPAVPDHQGNYPIFYAKEAGLDKNVAILEKGRERLPPVRLKKATDALVLATREEDFEYDWEEYQDEAGHIYFYHKSTKTSQWDRPDDVPKCYIHNMIHEDHDPADKPLPPEEPHDGSAALARMRMQAPGGQASDKTLPSDGFGVHDWEECQDENGDTYYWNKVTGESQWEKPIALMSVSGQAAADHLAEREAELKRREEEDKRREEADEEERKRRDEEFAAKEKAMLAEFAAGAGKQQVQKALAMQESQFNEERKALEKKIMDLEHKNELLEHKVEQIPELEKHLDDAQEKIKELNISASEAAQKAATAAGSADAEAIQRMKESHDQALEALKQNATQDLAQLRMKLEAENKEEILKKEQEYKALQQEMEDALEKAKSDEEGHILAVKQDMQKQINILQHTIDLKTKEYEQAVDEKEAAEAQKQLAVDKALQKAHAQSLGDLMGQKLIAKIGHKHDEADKQKLMQSYLKESALRKKVYNELEDLKGAIRVFCRMRPESHAEKERGAKMCVKLDEGEECMGLTIDVHGRPQKFGFDRVFGPGDSQAVVFEDTKRLIQSAIDGFNVCIFAYGQTGSGKSFTMIGAEGADAPPELKGLTPRAVDEIWNIKDHAEGKYTVEVGLSMFELYQDELQDLLRPEGEKAKALEIRIDKKNKVEIIGGQTIPVSSAEDLTEKWKHSMTRRHVRATKMNAVSSRSHLVQVIYLTTIRVDGKRTVGKLTLVDLAGSERSDRTGTTGEGAKEALAINKSLSALGNVINALTTSQKHIPYRNSNLTMLMRDSIGGNSKTLMFVNISPADDNAQETFSSLNFAQRCKKVTNKAKPGVSTKELEALKKEVADLKAQLAGC